MEMVCFNFSKRIKFIIYYDREKSDYLHIATVEMLF